MFDFPNTPTVGQQFTPAGGPTYQWNGTGWTLLGAPTAGMLNQQVFTSSGTYTPTPGMQTAIIECVGGGGAGGGATAAASITYIGGGGGGGGYSRRLVTAAQIGASQSITIGAGGVAASAADGGGGGDTYIGTSYGASLCGAKGGGGGSRAVSGNVTVFGGAGGVAGIAPGGIAAAGNGGGAGAYNITVNPSGCGTGAPGPFGGGAPSINLVTSAAAGVNAGNYGGGGGGAFVSNTGGSLAGGNGSPGIVIITEYANVSVGTATGATSHTGGFINKFRNGTFDVAQRGTGGSQGTGAAAYTLDGWILGLTGAATSWSQQYNSQMSGNVLQINSSAGMTQTQLYQRIESSIAVQLLNYNKTAQPVTFQCTIYNNTGNPLTPQLQTGYPTAKDNFATVTTDVGPVSLQTIAPGQIGTVAYTFTPNVACQMGYQVMLLFGAQLAAGTLIHVGYADLRATPGLLTGLNNNPPPVEMRPIQQELAFCQRYYWDPANGGSTTALATGNYNSAAGLGFAGVINTVTTMRASPTVASRNTSFGNANALTLTVLSPNTIQTALTFLAAGVGTCSFNMTASAEL